MLSEVLVDIDSNNNNLFPVTQKNMNMSRPKASKSGSLGIPRSTTAQLPNTNKEQSHDQDSKASLGSSSRSDKTVSRETYETQRLLEATKEIVNLMHKDYKGMARRSPPIHNQEPWH